MFAIYMIVQTALLSTDRRAIGDRTLKTLCDLVVWSAVIERDIAEQGRPSEIGIIAYVC